MKILLTIAITTYFCLFSFSTLMGQNNSAKIKQNDLTKLGISGNVKTVTEIYIKYGKANEDGEYIAADDQTKKIMLLNDKGNMTEETSYESNGNIDSKRVYTYDVKGNLITHNFFVFDKDKKKLVLFGKYVYKYDNNNNIIEAGEYDGSIYTKSSSSKYDEKGNRTEFVSYFKRYSGAALESSKITYKYDDKGNKIEEILDSNLYPSITYKYDEKGNEIEKYTYKSDGSLTLKETRKYDDINNMIEFINYEQNGSSYLKYIYVFDSNGNKTEVNVYNPDGTLKIEYCEKYKYEYNAVQNWIKKTEFVFRSVPKKMTKREVIYN